MAKILVSHHDKFFTIIKRLHQAGHEIIALQPAFVGQLANLDVESKALASFVSPDIRQEALNEAGRLIRAARPPKNGFKPGALEFMQANAIGLLIPRLNDLTSFVMALDTVRPDLVLLHNDVEPLHRLAALWARRNNKPCLHVPHAVYLDIEKGQPGDDIHDIVTASHIAVAGRFQRDWYARRGQAELITTGLPQFDKLASIPHNPRIARQHLGLKQVGPVVMYASSWRQDTNLLGAHDGVQETYLAMVEVMSRMPDTQFVVKLHPRDVHGAQWHIEQAREARLKNCYITAAHLESCLQASHLVLCYSGSNVLLEASFFPWLRLACTQGYEDDSEVVKIPEPEPERIMKAIKASLSVLPPDKAQFREKYLGPTDGQASERIAALVEKLCQAG